MRYIRQPDPYSCGPVAIINLLKWLGVKGVGLRQLSAMKALLRTDKEFGTMKECMGGGVCSLIGAAQMIQEDNITLRELEHYLASGAGIILHYHFKDKEQGKSRYDGHYVFMTRSNNKEFPVLIANEMFNGPEEKYWPTDGAALVKREHLKARLRARGRKNSVEIYWMKSSPFCWVIYPEGKNNANR